MRSGRAVGVIGLAGVLLLPSAAVFAYPEDASPSPMLTVAIEGQAPPQLCRRSRLKRHKRARQKLRQRQVSRTQRVVNPGPLERPRRYEFGDVRLYGQAPRAGAIVLMARQRTPQRSMVAQREQFRREILRTVYPSSP